MVHSCFPFVDHSEKEKIWWPIGCGESEKEEEKNIGSTWMPIWLKNRAKCWQKVEGRGKRCCEGRGGERQWLHSFAPWSTGFLKNYGFLAIYWVQKLWMGQTTFKAKIIFLWVTGALWHSLTWVRFLSVILFLWYFCLDLDLWFW